MRCLFVLLLFCCLFFVEKVFNRRWKVSGSFVRSLAAWNWADGNGITLSASERIQQASSYLQ